MTLISTLPLTELCEMYDNAWIMKLAKQRNPYLFMWKLETIEEDMNQLFEAMINKIPDTHTWDIEQIKQGLAPSHSIKPGNRYRHYGMVLTSVELQVVKEEDELWRCRQYVNGAYTNSVLVKTNTILTHYQLITLP